MNMGDSVNSEKWEAYFSTDAAGEFGYLSTNNNSLGETDIAKVKLNKWQQAKSFVQIKGKMVNAKSNKAVDAELTYDVISEDGVKTVTVTATNGSYDITLPYGKKYVITSKADNYFDVKDTIDLMVADLNKEVNRDFYLVPEIVINDYNDNLRLDQDGNIVERKRISLDDNLTDLKPGEILVTNNILFDFAKSLLRNEAYAELDKIVRMMRANPTMKIELAAYTDEIGNGKRNQDLSEDRAFAAKQYLLSKNIEADRIISKGFGKLNPIASNKTEEGRQKNRRVEFKILEK